MGVTYTMTVTVGVEIDLNWVWDEEEYTPYWCDHDKDENDQFCPTCGVPKPKPRTTRSFSDAFCKLVDEEELYDAMYNGSLGKLLPSNMGCELHDDNCGNEVLLAGTQIACFGHPQWGENEPHEKLEVPVIPTQKELFKALDEAGIPYLATTYGLHKTCMGS